MDLRATATRLRERALELDEDSPVRAFLLTEAEELEKAGATEGAEGLIEERVKAGDLVKKETHEKAVKDAKAEGEKTVRDEIAAAEQAATEKAEVLKARIKQIEDKKLDPDQEVRKDKKTIAQIVEEIPSGEEGDKVFAEQLDQWSVLCKPLDDKAVASRQTRKATGGIDTGTSKATTEDLPVLGIG